MEHTPLDIRCNAYIKHGPHQIKFMLEWGLVSKGNNFAEAKNKNVSLCLFFISKQLRGMGRLGP